MDGIVPVYRPSLLDAPIAQAAVRGSDAPVVTAVGAGSGVAVWRGVAPNPFRIDTAFRFSLPRGGPVSLRVYDIAGKLVATLRDSIMPAGEQSITFRAGDTLPSGMYFMRLRVGAQEWKRSVVLAR